MPPLDSNIYLQALWHDARNNWMEAHRLIQDIPDKHAARIHAYLHRKDGDEGNARYWYHKADTSFPDQTAEQEWQTLVEMFL